MISSHAVRRLFGDFAAVDDLTFDVAPGAICSLLGPNGAGKSTAIRVLTGLLPITAGVAQVGGCDVTAELTKLRRCIGVLPDDLGLFDSLTIGEHLSLTAAVHRMDSRTARRRTDQLLDALNWGMRSKGSPRRARTGCEKRQHWRWPSCQTPRSCFLMSRSRALIRSHRERSADCFNRLRTEGRPSYSQLIPYTLHNPLPRSLS